MNEPEIPPPPPAATVEGAHTTTAGGGCLEVGPAHPVPAIVAAPILAPPKPKPVIVPERTEDGWRTPSLLLRRAGGGFFLALHPDRGEAAQVVHLTFHQLERLLRLIDAEQGLLWRKLSEIPLERPLPSRAMEEELRVLFRAFGHELRTPRFT